jgi:hypothetical protein
MPLPDAAPPAAVPRQPSSLRQVRAAVAAQLIAKFVSMRLADLMNSVRADEPGSGWSRSDACTAVDDAISASLIVAEPGETGDLILRAVEASRDVA